MVRQRVRIRFSKSGELRFLGHHDLARTCERLFRRAELPLAFSQGYHPKPRIIFPLALALGVEGRDEVLELELAEELPAEEISNRLRRQSVPGLQVLSLETFPPGAPKAKVERITYEIEIPPQRLAAVQTSIEEIMQSPDLPLPKPGRLTRDYRGSLERLEVVAGRLRMVLRVEPQGSLPPRALLERLGLGDLEANGGVLVRTQVDLAGEVCPATGEGSCPLH